MNTSAYAYQMFQYDAAERQEKARQQQAQELYRQNDDARGKRSRRNR
jgi:hypothetical protein